MKKLIFVRHGKAEDSENSISDFERSLTIKGKTTSRQMARKLADYEKSLGSMISSPAFRAIETALIFAGEFRAEKDNLILNSNIYYKMNFRYLIEILSVASEDTDIISFFGHNPSFTQIPDELSVSGCDFVPKSGVIGISFKVKSWKEITQKSGKLEYFLKPEKII